MELIETVDLEKASGRISHFLHGKGTESLALLLRIDRKGWAYKG